LLGVMALQQGCAEARWGRVLVGMALFGLALLSKTNALTLVPIALLLHAYREPRFWDARTLLLLGCCLLVVAAFATHLLLACLGFAACLLALLPRLRQLGRPALVLLGLAMLAGLVAAYQVTTYQPADGYILLTEATQLNNVLIDPTQARLARPTAIANLGRYLGLFLYPHPLMHMYGYGQVPLLGLGAPLTLLSLGLLILGFAGCIVGLPRRAPVAFGLAFFLCTFSIYSNFFVTAPDTMADRFLFLPSLGLGIALVFGLWALTGVAGAWVRARRSGLMWVVMAPLLLAASIKTLVANRDWKSDATLIKNRIAVMENSAPAQAMLGFVLYREARESSDPVVKDKTYQAALYALHRALAIYPQFYMAWNESGKVFAEVGRFEKAELCFLKAIQLSPRSPDAHGHLGTMFFTRGQYAAAVPYLENALSLHPDSEPHVQMLGRSYLQLARWLPLRRLGEYGSHHYPYNAEFARLTTIAARQLALPAQP
jgi:hypothetical protein